jgi:G3E family GTPase
VQLDGVVTVVDAEQALTLPDEEARLARAQVAGGDLMVLNKVDLVDEARLGQLQNWLRGIRPGVTVFETTQCKLPMEILLGTGRTHPGKEASAADPAIDVHVHKGSTEADAHQGDHAHDHDEHALVFDTWTYTADALMTFGLMKQVLTHLPETVFRAKGFVYAEEKPHRRLVFQLVGRRATVSAGEPWGDEIPQTRLVFIARRGTVNIAAVEKTLSGCQAPANRKLFEDKT